MSLCESGVEFKVKARNVAIEVLASHPLVLLSKLKLRIHLAVFLLQQLFNKTDRQIEYDVKDNAAYQLFCGQGLVERWHCPDHTKIEAFRSRLSPDPQKALANHIAYQAVQLGFAEPGQIDIDSMIQEAHMAYPSDCA